MSLAAGTRLGPYEVISVAGSGGMGEVYRARDTRLGRDVAIKVLPPAFANDADRRARFEREAQAVAALSHPNIVAIHDTGLHGDPNGGAQSLLYVVMELLSGQTLRERLNAGALPVRKAVEIAVQVARGLGAAHGKGLVHRDLKPENVFLLDDGQVKILDFGLARQSASESGDAGSQATRTIVAATDPGTVMGTVGYMAPEQVRGLPVDARADVFAFGVVLYEMVSGTRAFQRETAADTMTAILTQDPPELATASRPELSPALDRIIRHCLEKNPNERFQSARDVAFALEALSGSASSTPSGAAAATAAAPLAPSKRGLSPIVIALVAVAALIGGVFVAGLVRAPVASQFSFTMKTFETQTIFNARFMPDADTIVFSAANTGNRPLLYEIRPGTLEARRFGPDDTHLLSISSKGELAVLMNATYIHHRLFGGTLARMTLEGAPKAWIEQVREADWSPDGTTVALIRESGGRDRLEYPAGNLLYEVNGYLSDPRVSPDGTRVAFMEHPGRWDDRGYVKVVDRSKKVTQLAGEYWGEEGLAWKRDGSGIYFGASAISGEGDAAGAMSYQAYEVPADGSKPASFVLTSPGDFTVHDLAADGRWLATRDEIRFGTMVRGAGQSEDRDVTWLNKCWTSFLSPDGQRVLFSDGNAGANYGLEWRKVDGSPIVRLGDGDAAGWSRDGHWAMGFVTSSSAVTIYPTGAGEPRRLNTSPVTYVESARWAADSKTVMVLGSEPGGRPRYYRVPIEGGSATPVLPDTVGAALFAPDGRTAFGVDGDGRVSIYPLTSGSPRPLGQLDRGDLPIAYSDDGRAVFLQIGNQIPADIERLDLTTGKRTAFKKVGPADRTGIVRLFFSDPLMKTDGSQYTYSYVKRLSTLFMVSRQGQTAKSR